MLQFRMVNMIVSTMALRKLGPFSIQCFTAQRFSQPSVSNFEIISHKFVIYWMICVKIEQYSLSLTCNSASMKHTVWVERVIIHLRKYRKNILKMKINLM